MVAGVLSIPGVATKTFALALFVLRAIEAEYIEEALKPATARATTKVRMAIIFMCEILLGSICGIGAN